MALPHTQIKKNVTHKKYISVFIKYVSIVLSEALYSDWQTEEPSQKDMKFDCAVGNTEDKCLVFGENIGTELPTDLEEEEFSTFTQSWTNERDEAVEIKRFDFVA